MCINMHDQECVSIHTRHISNKPARNYPDNTDKGCASICTVKNVCLYTFDVYPMNLQETIQNNTDKGCASICTVKNVCLYTFDVYPMNLQETTIQTKQTKKAQTCV